MDAMSNDVHRKLKRMKRRPHLVKAIVLIDTPATALRMTY
jgi:hypothetical protein